jgi:hypothetical protein
MNFLRFIAIRGSARTCLTGVHPQANAGAGFQVERLVAGVHGEHLSISFPKIDGWTVKEFLYTSSENFILSCRPFAHDKYIRLTRRTKAGTFPGFLIIQKKGIHGMLSIS